MAIIGLKGQTVLEVFQETPLASALQCGYGCASLEIYTVGCVCVCVCVLVAQLCLTLCNSMDYSLPGFSVHENLQARMLERVAIPFSRGSSQPRDGTQVSHTAGGFLLYETPGKPYILWIMAQVQL